MLQATVLEKEQRLPAEAARRLADLAVRRPQALLGHSLRVRAKRMPARIRRVLASHPAEPLMELVLVEPESLWVEALP